MNKFVLDIGIGVLLLVFTGCGGNDEPAKIDCDKSDLSVTVESTDPESCDMINGTITAMAMGGKAPYTYALNAGAFGQNATFTGLSAGDYILRVKDKNGCIIQSDDIELRIPGNDLNVSVITEPDTECLSNNGSVTVTATGGTEPYQYKINNGAFGDEVMFTALANGTHTVTVKDAAGCVFPKVVSVPRGNTGTSLTIDIMPIVQGNCAINNCHNGAEEPNLSSAANVRANATKIKSLTQSGEMPKEGSLTAADKALIACWVDDGANNN